MDCRICASTDLEPVIDLGMQPWCNHFLKPEEVGGEPFYPLRVVYCHACSTAQLDYTVPKETMFGDHTYLSGVTRALSDHFGRVATAADVRLAKPGADKSVLDIGSNDGTQLKHFQNLGYDVLGVESSKTTADIANQAGVTTLRAFFNHGLADALDRKFDVINAAGVFFHLEELHSVTRGIKRALKRDGIFVVQFLSMKCILENLAFDQIYHEHLLYYNLANIETLLRQHGLALFDAYLAPIHGGSMIAFVTHEGVRPRSTELKRLLYEEQESRCNEIGAYRDFARRIERMKQVNLAFLDTTRARGKSVFGMGAPVKGNTLLNYFGIGGNYLRWLVEKNRLRRGLYSPGMHLPIVMEDELRQPPDVYYVLAWNFKQEILANNKHLLERGVEFYFPIEAKAA